MSLAEDLLEQADHLASRDAGRPRQASLRRAVSTAYYSLFHLLIEDAAGYLVGNSPLAKIVARSFDHKNLRGAAISIGEASRNPNGAQGLRSVLRQPISLGLAEACDTFVNLQEQRHRADYDLSKPFTRSETKALVIDAYFAHATWRHERTTHNARVFILASAKLLTGR